MYVSVPVCSHSELKLLASTSVLRPSSGQAGGAPFQSVNTPFCLADEIKRIHRCILV